MRLAFLKIVLTLACLWSSEPFLAAQDIGGNPKIKATQKFSFKASSSTIPRKVFFTPDGKLFAASDVNDFVVRETATGKEKSRAETNGHLLFAFYRFAMASDSKHLLFSQYDSVRRFELESGREVGVVPLPRTTIREPVNVMGLVPDHNQFLFYADGVLQIREAITGKVIRDTAIHRKDVPGYRLFQVSNDHKWHMVEDTGDTSLGVRKVETGELVATLKGHTGKIESACFSPTGKWIASTGEDKTARIWKTQSGEMLHKIALPDEGLEVAFSPDEKWLAVGMGGSKCRILLLDAATGKELLSWRGFPEAAKRLTFHPQGHLLAGSGGRYIQIWDLADLAAAK